jgi:hypothetical protein
LLYYGFEVGRHNVKAAELNSAHARMSKAMPLAWGHDLFGFRDTKNVVMGALRKPKLVER